MLSKIPVLKLDCWQKFLSAVSSNSNLRRDKKVLKHYPVCLRVFGEKKKQRNPKACIREKPIMGLSFVALYTT